MRFNRFPLMLTQLFFPQRKPVSSQGTIIPAGVTLERFDHRAIVDETIHPYFGGRVRFHHSWWPAFCQQNITLAPGEFVYVVGRHNITLLVEPISPLKRGENWGEGLGFFESE
jgi:membrane protein implicated in regulation of membrane protease activity